MKKQNHALGLREYEEERREKMARRERFALYRLLRIVTEQSHEVDVDLDTLADAYVEFEMIFPALEIQIGDSK